LPRGRSVARVNILQQVSTDKGWRNAALPRKKDGRIKWPTRGRYLIEWRQNGRRQRAAAGVTPSAALEAQKRKRLELEAGESGLEFSAPEDEDNKKDTKLPLAAAVENFLDEIKTFRKPLTHQKYEYILQLFAEYAAPK